ncbi:MAG TPA: ATP-binding protein [Patescibacteria group bacterium]|nr:ATP-binding protein [Patescibacteria group bacterium]
MAGLAAFELRSRIKGEESDLPTIHLLRNIFMRALGEAGLLSEEEKFVTEECIGEAISNAFRHSVPGGYVTLCLEISEHDLRVKLSNPSQGYAGEVRSPEHPSEHGYGRLMMEGMIDELRKSNLEVEEDYRCSCRNGHRRTVLCLGITKKTL